MQVYPEIPNGPIKEIWHAQKWREDMSILRTLSPMYDAGNGRHYYVNELAQTDNGDLVIPFRWFIQDGKIHANA